MYSTDVFRGGIYQGYVPAPVWPAFSPTTRKAFANLDRGLVRVAGNALDDGALAEALVHDRADKDERVPGVLAACRFASALGHISRDELLTLNALATGYPSSRLRETPIWIGGAGPATAWHIGSPANQLPKLVDAVLAHSGRNDLPATLRGSVSLMRLLQIHPFRDGNGRTARLFAFRVMARQLGPSRTIADLLSMLWRRHEFDLHSASVAIRDAGDWQPYFDRILSWSTQSGITTHPGPQGTP